MREQELKLEKVKKSCKTAKRVASVFRGLLIAATILCVVCAAILFIMRANINPMMAANSENLTFGELGGGGILRVSMDVSRMLEDGMYAEVCGIYCGFGAVCCLIAALVFGAIRKIFLVVEQSETPFAPEVLQKLKRIFITITVVLALFDGVGIALLVGLCFWCIYCILDYGMALQTEVDEIL